jgi:hypothetical protein
MGGMSALHLAEMIQENYNFAIHGGGIIRGTFGSHADFKQGSDSFNFGVWVHCLRLDGWHINVET